MCWTKVTSTLGLSAQSPGATGCSESAVLKGGELRVKDSLTRLVPAGLGRTYRDLRCADNLHSAQLGVGGCRVVTQGDEEGVTQWQSVLFLPSVL